MDVLVVGAGSMGRWIGETLVPETLAFADVDRDVAEAAAEAAGGRVAALEGTVEYEMVVLAVPMAATPTAIAEQAHRATEAVVDVAGTMTEPVDAMADAAPDREQLSLHPLFAPHNAPGPVAAVEAVDGQVTEEVRTRLEAAGCRWLETTAAEHDRAMETIQSGAHTAVLAYALAAGSVPEGMETPVSAGLADLVELMTGNDPAVYAAIQSAYGQGAAAVADAAERLAAADEGEFRERYLEAGRSPVLDEDGGPDGDSGLGGADGPPPPATDADRPTEAEDT